MGILESIFGSAATAKGCELGPKDPPAGYEFGTFAGGCFWGLELAYQRVPGVVKTTVGYTGGQKLNPTYEEVCSGRTGHTEVVQVTYDPKECAYETLLDTFFDKVDPTTKNRQGGDSGTQYRSGIFYHSEAQKEAAAKKIKGVNEKLAKGEKVRAGRPYEGSSVVSELTPAGDYYVAEAYHQQYLERGGRFGTPQSAAKGCNDNIRCYG